MSDKCEFCGKYFDGGGWYSRFKESSYSKSFYTYNFCCRGHLDSFCNQTSMLEVNSQGLTPEEEQEKEKVLYKEKYRPCEECGRDFLRGTGITRVGRNFCSKICLKHFFNDPNYIRTHFHPNCDEDELFIEAALLFVEKQMVSRSRLQWKFSIEWDRADEIVDQLILAGIVYDDEPVIIAGIELFPESKYRYTLMVKDFYDLLIVLEKRNR
jgi:DNA segregation ATPase FtsK/SpoIIIE-like protein